MHSMGALVRDVIFSQILSAGRELGYSRVHSKIYTYPDLVMLF